MSREVELFVAEQTGEYGLYWARSLAARVKGNTALADQQLALLAEKTGQDAAATQAGQLMLIDPATRDMVLQSPGMQAMPSFLRIGILFVLQDERFWPELAAMEDSFPVLHQVIPSRSPWLLNDPRLRPILERFGAVGYWLNHGLPEFCDGTLESWICEL
jgi:hypothetical protein